jgi:hypothetical protein
MAAVDISRVVALTNKALALTSKGHWARAAEVYAEAVMAAQALQQPDCVIVADLQASQANALLAHAQTDGVPPARCVELQRAALLEMPAGHMRSRGAQARRCTPVRMTQRQARRTLATTHTFSRAC